MLHQNTQIATKYPSIQTIQGGSEGIYKAKQNGWILGKMQDYNIIMS